MPPTGTIRWVPATDPGADAPGTLVEPAQARSLRFPSTLTVLALVTVLVWALGFLVPAGRYRLDAGGAPIAGTYARTSSSETTGERAKDLLLSPVNGLYGIRDPATGRVGPGNSGALYGSAGVFAFVLAIGAFVAVVFATGGLEHAIDRLAVRMGNRGWLLIVVIMSLFSLLGSIEGFSEETLGFYGLIVPLMLALGYDRMVAVGVILLGAGVGVTAGTLDPFAVGVASSVVHVSVGDGIVARAVMWVVLTTVTIAYVLRYAHKVKHRPETSRVGLSPQEERLERQLFDPPRLARRHKLVLGLVGATFALMIYASAPWASIASGPNAHPYSWELDWNVPELAAMFIVASIVIGVVGGLSEAGLTDTLLRGAGEFLYPAIVVVLARGATVVMNNSLMTDTVLHSIERSVSGTSSGVFGVLIFLVNLPLAFLIPSPSGHATLAMPIFGPLADLAHVHRSVVITAWGGASGWMNLFAPTTAVVMGGISLAKVGYNQYLRFALPLLGIMFAIICTTIFLEASLSLP